MGLVTACGISIGNSFSIGHRTRELHTKNTQIKFVYTLDLYYLDTVASPLGEDRER